MTMPVTGVGNASIVARTPSRVLCRPAPSMRMPMPSNSGQVARIGFMSGLLRRGRCLLCLVIIALDPCEVDSWLGVTEAQPFQVLDHDPGDRKIPEPLV